MSKVAITFLGASGTVTGSKYLVETSDRRILIDCGLFQGNRDWSEKNWDTPPVDLSQIDAVLLTHAHIDHSGMLPRYYKLGMRAPIYCTGASADLSKLVILDSAHLQEEEAEWRNREKKTRFHPALPLYTRADALGVSASFKEVPYNRDVEVVPGVHAHWRKMGHILGACSITLSLGGKSLAFSGDIGRYSVPILRDPEAVPLADLLLVESTYGDRLHAPSSQEGQLAEIVNRTAKRGGVILIPAFAVGRTQSLLYYLRELKEQRLIPDIPIVIDSPMATDATAIYRAHTADYDEEALKIVKEGRQPFHAGKLRFVSDRTDSIKLNAVRDPMIIIAASGMLSGGRILHHLKQRISDARNTVLLVGFQPSGGRGAALKSGAQFLRLFGSELPVRAEIAETSGLSAHADRAELLRWCRSCPGTPGQVMVVHGEPEAAASFCSALQTELMWSASVAKYLQRVEI